METAELTYRIFEKHDLLAVLDLWENHSGWGAIDEATFNEWYIHNPHGTCPVFLVVEDETVLGQVVFIPTRLFANGEIITSFKISAPILHPQLRTWNLSRQAHPALKLIFTGLDFLKQQGYVMVYGLPAHGWLSTSRVFTNFGYPKIRSVSEDCYRILLSGNISRDNIQYLDEFIIKPVDSFDDAFDELWERAVDGLEIKYSVVRDKAWMKRKNSNHLTLAAYHHSKLIGYCVVRKRDGLLVDILAINKRVLGEIFLASLQFLKERYQTGALPFDEIKVMASSNMMPLIQKVYCEKIDFQFAFFSLPIGESTEVAPPEEWYIMPDD